MGVYFAIYGYLLAALYYFSRHKAEKKNTLIFLGISGILFILVASLRYAIGFDYAFYQTAFETVKASPVKALFLSCHKEWGFLLFNKTVAAFGGSYHIFLLVFHTVITILVMRFLYLYVKKPWYGVFFYFSLQIFAQSMNFLRQSMAAAIFMQAYPYLRADRFGKYAVCVFIASLFHESVLVMLPFYFFLRMKWNRRNLLFLSVAVILCYLFFDTVYSLSVRYFFHSYAQYEDSLYWQSNSLKYVVFPAIWLLLGLFYALLTKGRDRILWYGAFYAFVFSFFITKHFIIERISIYFYPFYLILLPKLLESLPAGKIKRYASVSVIALGLACFSFSAVEGFHQVYPYISVFDRAVPPSKK